MARAGRRRIREKNSVETRNVWDAPHEDLSRASAIAPEWRKPSFLFAEPLASGAGALSFGGPCGDRCIAPTRPGGSLRDQILASLESGFARDRNVPVPGELGLRTITFCSAVVPPC
ncbi:hypothetical protein GCM10009527_075450 [Actinomadura nitritigenes]